jgi:dihydropteroate synthase
LNIKNQIHSKNTKLAEFQFDFSNGPKIMGIVNITPDSFYDGGKYSKSINDTIQHALKLINDGAEILDIGGESSRPGAEPVSETKEINRIIPIIEGIRDHSEILISVDTYKSKVARYALDAGADWINDISGLRFDEEMIGIAAEYDCPVVVMHMQGSPQSMQLDPKYNNVVSDLLAFFAERINFLNQNNLNKIIIDPGIGFGKTLNHNLEILNQIEKFQKFGLPVMVGVSRKSFIGSILNENVENRLTGSLAALSWLTTKEVDLVRVHDVIESVSTIKMINSIKKIKTNHY